MLPSDEKHPALGMTPPVDAGQSPTPPPLQNPLHQMYTASTGGGAAASANSNSPEVAAHPAASVDHQMPGGGLPAHMQNVAATPSHHAESADERAWVERAKTIIEQTQNDPYKRMQLLQQLRASYLEERFNKRTNEASSS